MARFLSTPSARRATVNLLRQPSFSIYFYPRPPRGGRLYLLTVPPTSIKEVNKALTRIMASKGIPYTNLIVGFKLAKATNANGINYATVVVDKRGILPPAVAQTAKAMRQEIKAKYKEIAITMDDYSTSASSNTMAADESALDVQVSDTEFTDVTDKDKDLPFV